MQLRKKDKDLILNDLIMIKANPIHIT